MSTESLSAALRNFARIERKIDAIHRENIRTGKHAHSFREYLDLKDSALGAYLEILDASHEATAIQVDAYRRSVDCDTRINNLIQTWHVG